METKEIHVCGSILKKESIAPIVTNILPNTTVVEADLPYVHYYGNRPELAKPNSLFLFTEPFYSLEEILWFSQRIDKCFMKDVNVAASVLSFPFKQVAAVRVKNFPAYDHLQQLQECFAKQGVRFAKKFQPGKEAIIRTSKSFVLEEAEEGIFWDKVETDKGYVVLSTLIDQEEFEERISAFRYNSNCQLFDAVKASIIFGAELTDVVRIYSENLNLELLRCVKKSFLQVDKKYQVAP